jgi:hypothetical protein
MPIDLNSIDLIFSLIYEDLGGFIEGTPSNHILVASLKLGKVHTTRLGIL